MSSVWNACSFGPSTGAFSHLPTQANPGTLMS